MTTVPEDRTGFLGGSDMAAILGLSRWGTPLSVWASKTGQVVKEDGNELYKRLGVRLEEVVSELFTEATGKKLIRANERRVHPKHPFLKAQIDRLILNEDAIFEAKTCSVFKAKEWVDDEIPQEYIVQVMHGLSVTGRKRGYIAVLIGNQDFKWKLIERDPVMIAEMTKRAVSFWQDFVIPKVMPGPIMSGDTDTLLSLFPEAEIGKEVDLGDLGARLCEQRASLAQDSISIGKQRERVENDIKALLGTAETGIAGSYRVAWKNVKRKAFNVAATEFRQFKIKTVGEAANGDH